MDSEDTQCNHKVRQVPGPREGQSSCVPALLTLLLILFHFLNINIKALFSSKGGVAQTSRHGCTAHPSQIAGRLLDTQGTRRYTKARQEHRWVGGGEEAMTTKI